MTRSSLLTRGYLAATHLIPLIAGPVLKRRAARGKEDPARLAEKRGRATLPRPTGRLIWLHGVGLGETLALRGLIVEMQALEPDLQCLVTSTTTKSAAAIAHQLPPNTRHQFLPLDAPGYRQAFLDHWQPDLAIWTDQDLWPGFVHDCTDRGIPTAIAAGRMSQTSYAKRARWAALYRDTLSQLALVSAQDEKSASHFKALGAKAVRIDGSLKPATPPLHCDAQDLSAAIDAIGDRFVWCVCPSHPTDEAIALAAHEHLLKTDPNALLIIAPRFPDRDITLPQHRVRRSAGTWPGPDHPLMLWDQIGETGLLYRLASAAYIGGTNDATEGHSPWEALHLGTAIFHGPRTAHFASDYAGLGAAGLAHQTTDPVALATLIKSPAPDATTYLTDVKTPIRTLAQDLLALRKTAHV